MESSEGRLSEAVPTLVVKLPMAENAFDPARSGCSSPSLQSLAFRGPSDPRRRVAKPGAPRELLKVPPGHAAAGSPLELPPVHSSTSFPRRAGPWRFGKQADYRFAQGSRRKALVIAVLTPRSPGRRRPAAFPRLAGAGAAVTSLSEKAAELWTAVPRHSDRLPGFVRHLSSGRSRAA